MVDDQDDLVGADRLVPHRVDGGEHVVPAVRGVGADDHADAGQRRPDRRRCGCRCLCRSEGGGRQIAGEPGPPLPQQAGRDHRQAGQPRDSGAGHAHHRQQHHGQPDEQDELHQVDHGDDLHAHPRAGHAHGHHQDHVRQRGQHQDPQQVGGPVLVVGAVYPQDQRRGRDRQRDAGDEYRHRVPEHVPQPGRVHRLPVGALHHERQPHVDAEHVERVGDGPRHREVRAVHGAQPVQDHDRRQAVRADPQQLPDVVGRDVAGRGSGN